MRISSDWLNDFVTVPATDKLAHLFEMAGVGVENLQDDNFTLEVTSNRGDWLSATGLAREIAAMTGGRFRTPSDEIAPDSFAREYSQQPFRIAVENGEDCNRYTARVIENVKVAQSPQWLKDRLTQCGVRPINNVVDVTNFVMLETGQPLHAFDADAISGDTIFIRRARDGETLQTLDGVERVLNGEVLVIADTEKPLGLAGVMGGQSSEVTQTTRHVLLESAHFSPRRIRRGRNTLALSSEASRRFERYVDANNVRRASDRAAQLLHELASGEVAPVIADSYLRVLAPRAVQMRVARCNALLGLQLSIEQIEAIFARLGFASTRADEANLEVTIPTFRGDIEREVDLIEEVARLHGYDLIPRTLPKTVNAMAGRSLSQRLEERAKSALLRGGHSEVVTLSMQSRADVARAGQNENAPVVSLRNPLSEDFVQLRTSLLPSMLGVLARNAATLNELPTRAARIFELGRVYVPRENGAQPDERRRLAIAAMGAPPAPHWDKKAAAAPPDFFALKAVVESLLAELHTAPARWQAARADGFHPGSLRHAFAERRRLRNLRRSPSRRGGELRFAAARRRRAARL